MLEAITTVPYLADFVRVYILPWIYVWPAIITVLNWVSSVVVYLLDMCPINNLVSLEYIFRKSNVGNSWWIIYIANYFINISL